MKKELIVKKNGRKGEVIWSHEFDIPETYAECLIVMDDDATIIENAVAHYKVVLRARNDPRKAEGKAERLNREAVNLGMGFTSFRHAILCAKKGKGTITPDEALQLQGIEKGII